MSLKTVVKTEDRVKKIIRHITNTNFIASECEIHPRKPCLLLLNNYNEYRFHCLYARHSTVWMSYNESQSCDIPEHYHEMIELYNSLGGEYVLPFAGHFRESSGYTIGLFRQPIHLYAPRKIRHDSLKETAYALVVFFCVVCHRLGGNVPDLKQFLFLYTSHHPVLCDIGSFNVENRVRLQGTKPHLNVKKWRRVLQKKTIRDVIRYLKLEFRLFFNQKKKKGKRCILDESEECFDTETHKLLCQSSQKSLAQVLQEFLHLMPNKHVQNKVILEWLKHLKPLTDEC